MSMKITKPFRSYGSQFIIRQILRNYKSNFTKEVIKINEPVNIDPEFQSLLPPLSAEEYKKLSCLCQKHGIQDNLKIWNGILIDGHNRYQIANEYGLNYEIEDMTGELPTRSAVVNWIIENQGARRNLTKSQLVRAWEQWEAERAKEAKERQAEAGGDKKSEKAKSLSSNLNEPIEPTDPIRTAAEVAEKIGVSENTYRDMKLITNEGTPEQVERMNQGGKGNGVNRIANEIREAQKPLSATLEAKKRHEEFEEKKQESIVNFSDIQQDREDRQTIASTLYLDISKWLSKAYWLKALHDGDFESLKGAVPQSDKKDFTNKIRTCVSVLNAILEVID